jgi:hypothetical protein
MFGMKKAVQNSLRRVEYYEEVSDLCFAVIVQ